MFICKKKCVEKSYVDFQVIIIYSLCDPFLMLFRNRFCMIASQPLSMCQIASTLLPAHYTVFKSKWQIVNLCSSKTTNPKAFKFSVNIGNNSPCCHAKTQILILNSLAVIKALKNYQSYGKNQFVPAITMAKKKTKQLVFLVSAKPKA